jgi:hypothetical protein
MTSFRVERASGQVTAFDLKILPPNGQPYLPSTKPASALLSITANPQAAGVKVALSASIGAVQPSEVTLSGDGMADATAMALFSSTVTGTAVISATAKGVSSIKSIPVIGPPTLVPDGRTLAPGGSVRVTVLTAGSIDSCQATPTPRISVTSGPMMNLMQGTGGMDQTEDGSIDIDVQVDPALAVEEKTKISCRDAFGQVATAEFIATPP